MLNKLARVKLLSWRDIIKLTFQALTLCQNFVLPVLQIWLFLRTSKTIDPSRDHTDIVNGVTFIPCKFMSPEGPIFTKCLSKWKLIGEVSWAFWIQRRFLRSNPTSFPNMFPNQIIMRLPTSYRKFSKTSLFIRTIKNGKGNKYAANKIIAKWTSIVKIE